MSNLGSLSHVILFISFLDENLVVLRPELVHDGVEVADDGVRRL
jgi:hypothetical protein